jgi:hypothetical protein
MDARRLARATLVAGALGFAAAGLLFLLRPAFATGLIDLAVTGPTGWSDVRAIYGGLELGVAAVLAYCAVRPAHLRPGIVLLLVTLGGMLLGRATSLSVDGMPGAFGWLLLAIELALFAVALLAAINLWATKRAQPADAAR